jgi:plastocyanin
VIRKILTTAIAAAALLAVAAPLSGVVSASSPRPPKPKIVTVGDDYYAPVSVKIHRGVRVRWKWLMENFNTHNVVLSTGPRGVKKREFRSSSGAYGINFVRKFTVPGSYKFVCTLHRALMQMTVTVKRPVKR